MPRIHWVEESDADGDVADVYQRYMEMRGRDYVPDILKCFSARPDFFWQVIESSDAVHFSDGHLTQRTKEMIATLVSALNRCPY